MTVSRRSFWAGAVALVLLHVFLMLFRYGQLPSAPVVTDEVVINDPAVSLAQGHGLVGGSFAANKYGLNKVYAHFPPLYPYVESLPLRWFGVSVYSLRATTTVCSLASTVVLLLLLGRLCVFGLMDWGVALLLQAVYCTSMSYATLERTARMESMVSLLVLGSLYAIFHALTVPAERRLPWLLAGGTLGALTLAVHPEAVLAVLLLGSLILVVVPTSRAVRLGSAAVFALVPLAVGLVAYRDNFAVAVKQFFSIAKDATKYGGTTGGWLSDALHARDVSTYSRNSLTLMIVGLMLVPAAAWVAQRRSVDERGLQYRMMASLSVVGLLLAAAMLTVMHMETIRCQFLFGALLVCGAMCVLGSRGLRRWEFVAGWALVVVQCAVAAVYLTPRGNRAEDGDPERFAAMVRGLPANATIAADCRFWLALVEAHRPVKLVVTGLDGFSEWDGKGTSPLAPFDVVILEQDDQWNWDAQQGRSKEYFSVGSTHFFVYRRTTYGGI